MKTHWSSAKTDRALCTLVVVLVALVYGGSLAAAFQFDDDAGLLGSPAIIAGNLWEMFRFQPNRALTLLTFAMNYRLNGPDVVGFHLVNVAIHLATCVVAFALGRQLLEPSPAPAARSPAYGAGLLALLFGLHPVQTEAVTYIWQRSTSLCTFFYLGALCLFADAVGRRRRGAPAAGRRLALALIAGALALFCKPIAATLPATALLVWWHLTRSSGAGVSRRLKEWWRWLAPWPCLVLLALAPMLLLGTEEITTIREAQARGTGLTSWPYFLTQLSVVRTYWRLLALPIRQCLDYDYPLTRAVDLVAVLSASFHALLIGAAYQLRRRAPAVWLGVAFFYVTISVESSIVPLEDVIFEHRLYLPSFGALLAAVALLDHATRRLPGLAAGPARRRGPALFTGAALLLGLPLGILTLQRNAVWSTRQSLWQDTVAKSPNKIRPHTNLGFALLAAGDIDGARLQAEAALALGPPSFETNFIEGQAAGARGRFGEAQRYFEAALRLQPASDDAAEQLGITLANLQRFTDARHWLARACAAKPWLPERRLVLARAQADDGDQAAATATYQSILAMPDLPEAARQAASADLQRLAPAPTH